MALLLIEDSILSDVADEINLKQNSTKKFKDVELATEIHNIPQGKFPILEITAPVGSTVTISFGEKNIFEEITDGFQTVRVNEFGLYKLQAYTPEKMLLTKYVQIDAAISYPVALKKNDLWRPLGRVSRHKMGTDR